MTDFQHREGSTGSAGVASFSEANVDRRERLRRLALESIDLAKDPYLMKNHLGSYECKLCLTLHNNEGSYLAHTQGKKHQANLARRAAKEAFDRSGLIHVPPGSGGSGSLSAMMIGSGAGGMSSSISPNLSSTVTKKVFISIGLPGYKITKLKDPKTGYYGLLIQIHYPQISPSVIHPLHRFMSSFEQKIETPDKHYQYLLVATEPYETIAFKIPSRELDMTSGTFLSHWDVDAKRYTIQFFLKFPLDYHSSRHYSSSSHPLYRR